MAGCKTNKDSFCHMCGEYSYEKNRLAISEGLAGMFEKHFGIIINYDEWSPNIICTKCAQALRNVESGKRAMHSFSVPMTWQAPKEHPNDCYFCQVNVKGMNKNKKWVYPEGCASTPPNFVKKSKTESTPQTKISEPVPSSFKDHLNENNADRDWMPSEEEEEGAMMQQFTQLELNDLVRDLELTKEKAELLASRLKEKQLLAPKTKVCFYRTRDEEFHLFFKEADGIVFCTDIAGLVNRLGAPFNAEDWRLFIDGSSKSLKFILLHNGNKLASIPVAYTRKYKESRSSIERILKAMKYDDYGFLICADFKVICILLGMQGGFTKFPCFICLWDSRARKLHYTDHVWPLREELKVGDHNVVAEALVPREKIIFPFLHIKLGLMKQFVKALNREQECFQYIVASFPELSAEKVKAGIFTGPQIRKLVNDPNFTPTMTDLEKNAWTAFVNVQKNLLGNHKSPEFVMMAKAMSAAFKDLGANMSVKLHFVDGHLDMFPENCGDVSEEQGERAHQDMLDVEARYKGFWDVGMLADYVWLLVRDLPNKIYRRKSSAIKFLNKFGLGFK